jgi:hypothetical protein
MNSDSGQHRWWHGAVLYQLYVRSWLDTNGDGYGDLGGVIARLDYLSWLGVDGIWLSPTMPSPDDDWGYDVSDYLGVHPDLGTIDDMDALIAGGRPARHAGAARPGAQPHQLGPSLVRRRGGQPRLRAPGLLRLVGPGPTAARRTTGWMPPAPAAWAWHEPTGQYYLHNFLASQPDLNWWEPGYTRNSVRFSGSGSTGASPVSASTSPTACTRTRNCATTRRRHRAGPLAGHFGQQARLQREPAGNASGLPGLAADRGRLPWRLPWRACAARRDLGR